MGINFTGLETFVRELILVVTLLGLGRTVKAAVSGPALILDKVEAIKPLFFQETVVIPDLPDNVVAIIRLSRLRMREADFLTFARIIT